MDLNNAANRAYTDIINTFEGKGNTIENESTFVEMIRNHSSPLFFTRFLEFFLEKAVEDDVAINSPYFYRNAFNNEPKFLRRAQILLDSYEDDPFSYDIEGRGFHLTQTALIKIVSNQEMTSTLDLIHKTAKEIVTNRVEDEINMYEDVYLLDNINKEAFRNVLENDLGKKDIILERR